MAIITRLYGAGGGASVSAADTCARFGLNVAPLSPQIRDSLMKLLGPVVSILCNLLDITPILGSPSLLERVMELVISKPAIELILIQEDVDIILAYAPMEQLQQLNNVFLNFADRQNKSVIVVLPPGNAEVERLKLAQMLNQGGIAVFPSMERAAKAIVNMRRYFRFRSS